MARGNRSKRQRRTSTDAGSSSSGEVGEEPITAITASTSDLDTIVKEAVRLAINTYKDRITVLETEIKENNEKMQKQLDSFETKVSKLERRIDFLEGEKRQQNLIVLGLVQNENEVPMTRVSRLLEKKLGLKPQIEKARRVGKTEVGKVTPILVTFPSKPLRDEVKRKRAALKGSGIIIVEDLTPDARTLLKEAKAHKDVAVAWSHDGIILVKKTSGTIMRVNSMADL